MPQQGKVATIVTNGFEDLELFYPMYRLMEAGFEVDVLTPDGKEVEGEYGYPVKKPRAVTQAQPDDYVALLLPGGVKNPDNLRMEKSVVTFIKNFHDNTDKPIFAICHGAWTLVEADVLNGVELTSYWSIRKDCENAGATWKDEPVVKSGRFVTSRHPPDLPQFGRAIVEALGVKVPGEAKPAR